ncbi:MAG: hypothetical protein IIY70_05120, partial [Oscillospiraceae bacterium]|nr:hypothetical protein [Oscillospiraceae bacterium]
MYSTNRALTLRIKKSTLSELILFLYLTTAAFRIVFAKLLSPLGLDFDTKYICIGLTMALYFLLCTKERKLLVRDFWMLYFVVVLFFLATYLLHPEYKLWYERADYGVLNYVLRPDNGIFLYLFIRLVNDP